MKKLLFLVVALLLLQPVMVAFSADLEDLKKNLYSRIDYVNIHFWETSKYEIGSAVYVTRLYLKNGNFSENVNLKNGRYLAEIHAWNQDWRGISQPLFSAERAPIKIRDNKIVDLDVDYKMLDFIMLPIQVVYPTGEYLDSSIEISIEGEYVKKASEAEYREKSLFLYLYYKPFVDEYSFTLTADDNVMEVNLSFNDIINSKNTFIKISTDSPVINTGFDLNLGVFGSTIHIPKDYDSIQDGINHLLAFEQKSGIIEIENGVYTGAVSVYGPADITIRGKGDTTVQSMGNVFSVIGSNTRLVIEKMKILRLNKGDDKNLLYSEAAVFSEMGPTLIMDDCQVFSNQIGVSTNHNTSSRILNSIFSGYSGNFGTGVKVSNSKTISDREGALVGANTFAGLTVGIDTSDTDQRVETPDNRYEKCKIKIKKEKTDG